ncbi:hypothetical protein CKO15_05500 [Halorhodospira abdelmalekii]|uniref:HD-GYP domain-containing protein n=1 Tax=Halorhodospira abdelmalekii TaxID=421629 RepID=UPI001905F7BD|nr:HD-GYP domain-containing protein [Halorhodospira abdelmalekii]MBK1734751.1 hypothetical protein [Halorhodospira abdelmalekii]
MTKESDYGGLSGNAPVFDPSHDGDAALQCLYDSLPLCAQTPDMRLHERLERLRTHINQRLNKGSSGGEIDRIAVAIYESKSGMLKTYSAAGNRPSELLHYEATLAEIPTLLDLATKSRGHIVQEYQEHSCSQEHSRKVRAAGLLSALILPLTFEHQFYGFIFFNSRRAHFFTSSTIEQLAPFADVARLLAVTSIRKTRVMRGAAQTALVFGRARDDETGGHLRRMADYSRLIARELATPYQLDDEYIEMVYQFAPAHDVGKVAVPDSILLKPGPLTDAEFAQMREHVTRGVAMVLQIAEELDLSEDQRTAVLRNIVAYHHERPDGSGYPTGCTGDSIPLEGRIVAVADVFDALTSERVYKPVWSLAEAAALLQREAAAGKLCPVCVEAFLRRTDAIVEIQKRHTCD